MNPTNPTQGGEGSNNQLPGASAAVLDRPLDVPVNPTIPTAGSSIGTTDPSLVSIEKAVSDLQNQAAQPPQTEQFMNQFSSGSTTETTQPVQNITIDSNLNSLTPTPAAEVTAPVEKTTADKWQELSDEVKAFLEEVTKDKIPA